TSFTGEFVWHCHILEHEDWEMMRPYRIVRG
ncbi:MAG: multicopper oxidase domain-containing protein, partial [Bacillota bacterium]